MSDELVLALANIGDISPKKVRLIINTYEKLTTGVKSAPKESVMTDELLLILTVICDIPSDKVRLIIGVYKSLGDGFDSEGKNF